MILTSVEDSRINDYEKTNSTIMKQLYEFIIKLFESFIDGLKFWNWTEKDIAPFIVLFLLGFFFSDIRDFVLSLFY